MTGANSFKTQQWNYVITPIDERYRSAFSPSDGVAFSQPNTFSRPEGCTVDATGNIIVADAGKDSVYKFSQFGDKIIGFGGPSVFSEPYAVAYFDKIVYVTDRGNNRILRFILSTDVQ
jgi:DNA-binding beta-propeller fold protein YncE